MAGRTQRKKRKDNWKDRGKGNRKASLIIAALAGTVIIIAASVLLFREKNSPSELLGVAANQQRTDLETASGNVSQNYQHLIGRWIRADGGYVIEIRNIDATGKLDVGYYNPRSINVSRGEVSVVGAGTKVFLELNDVGYPGSTYTLTYNPQKNALVGLYYQAAMGQTFEVVFVRPE